MDNTNKMKINISLLNNNINNFQNQNQHQIIIQNQINNSIFLEFNDYELNNLVYHDALIYDKRSFFQYYTSLIKRNCLLLFAFLVRNDYNPKIIKIYIFLFSIAFFYALGIIFISDSTIKTIYENNDTYNSIYQIPEIIYSLIIGCVIFTVIKYIVLPEKKIAEIRKMTIKENINAIQSKIINNIKCKILIFFIITFILLIFFWFYIGLFGAVYKNIQIYLLKKVLINYTCYLLYPFLLSLIPGLFRINSLKSKDNLCLYSFSQRMQIM